MYILIYLLIGLVIAFINNFLWKKVYNSDNKNEDNPGMIIVLMAWIILWPFGIMNMITMVRELIRNK